MPKSPFESESIIQEQGFDPKYSQEKITEYLSPMKAKMQKFKLNFKSTPQKQKVVSP